MRDYRLDQPLPHPTAAGRLADEHIADPGKGRAVGDDPGEPDQLAVLEGAKAQAVVDRAVEDGPRNSPTPIGLTRQPTVDPVAVHAPDVGRDLDPHAVIFSVPPWGRVGWGR